MTITWDYSDYAATYDQRADYCPRALDRMLDTMGCKTGMHVADIGAGTAKLSKPLAERGLVITSVEPNDNMRAFGQQNTADLNVQWIKTTAEDTRLASQQFDAVTFGSSFNVVEQQRALQETARILKPNGWFACMWNHRDLDDPLQRDIESTIKRYIPNYDYGSRRQDPSAIITASGLFGEIVVIEETFNTQMKRDEALAAWASHATLERQAKDQFATIIDNIAALFSTSMINVPYTTRIWCAPVIQLN